MNISLIQSYIQDGRSHLQGLSKLALIGRNNGDRAGVAGNHGQTSRNLLSAFVFEECGKKDCLSYRISRPRRSEHDIGILTLPRYKPMANRERCARNTRRNLQVSPESYSRDQAFGRRGVAHREKLRCARTTVCQIGYVATATVNVCAQNLKLGLLGVQLVVSSYLNARPSAGRSSQKWSMSPADTARPRTPH